jgi:F-type H+-transporting ATPase subunit epsilon
MIVKILTPEKSIFDAKADEIILTTVEGRVGILDHHAPLLASLNKGMIMIRIGTKWQEIQGSKGLLEVQKNLVTVLLEG